MADEYISREEAKAKIREKFKRLADRIKVNEVLNSIPAADVAPIRHGRWMHEYDEDWCGGGRTYCTNCGHGYADGAFHEVEEFNFCPACGAQMEAGNDSYMGA